MIVKIADNQWIYFVHITDAEEQIIWDKFSVSKPNSYIDPSIRGNWDGVYRKYNRVKKRMARPLLGLLKKVCRENNLPIEVVDGREEWKYECSSDVAPDLLSNIILEEYQVNAIKSCIKSECGIIEVPTGGGKGEIICGLCATIKCPTLILADQRVVVDQLKRRLELRDVADEVGLFYAGRKPDDQLIVVGLIQSLTGAKKPPKVPSKEEGESDRSYKLKLAKYDEKYKAYKTRLRNVKFLNEYVKKAEMIIVDECDKAVSISFKNLFKFQFRGRRRYGFSGTPYDPDKPVEALVMQEHLGSVIFRETRDTVLAKGRIIPTVYKSLGMFLDGNPKEASAYDIAYDEYIINNPTFHNTVCALVNKHKGEKILILVDRESLGQTLLERITNSGQEAHFIYGKTPKNQREIVLRRFEQNEFSVLIGGKIINRGLDLSGGCDRLIIAGSGKLQSDLIQKVGRALRKNDKGHSVVYDFFFRSNKHLYNHSKARLKAMVRSGFETQVVFPGGVIDGREFVENRNFRIPPRYIDRG